MVVVVVVVVVVVIMIINSPKIVNIPGAHEAVHWPWAVEGRAAEDSNNTLL